MKYVPKAVTRAVGRTVLKTQKNSPTLLFIAGVGGAVTATVLACRATLKAQPVIDNWNKDLIELEAHASHQRGLDDTEYKRDLAHMHMINIAKVSRLYAPSVGIGIVSLFCLTKSHQIMSQRNAALTTAYVGLQTFLEGYRGRVREAIGEEKERDVYYASTPVELIEETDKGPKKVYGSAPGQPSPYSAIFDESNGNWQESHEYNTHFIRIQEQILTDKLRAKGFLFLNDVYRRLDIPETQNGQLVGWMIPYDQSDDFVEINITPMHDFHGSLMLDFNCAGLVYHMLDDAKMSR